MKVNRIKLIEELSLAKECLSQQDYVPILTHFCFDGGDLTAFDGVQAIEMGTSLDISCAVPGNIFLKTLLSIPNKEIDIIQKESHILIKYGSSKIKLAILPKEEFLQGIPDGLELPINITIHDTILSGIEYCFGSANTDPALNSDVLGIIFQVVENTLNIYASDRKRISKYKTDIFVENPIKLLVPLKFCKYLIKHKPKGTLYFGEDFVKLVSDDMRLFTKTTVEEPMDLENKIITNIDVESVDFCNSTKEFSAVLDRCKNFDVKTVLLDTDEDGVVVTAENEFGDIYEKLDMPGMSFKDPICFEVDFLIQALKHSHSIGFVVLNGLDMLFGKKGKGIHVLGSHKEYNA